MWSELTFCTRPSNCVQGTYKPNFMIIGQREYVAVIVLQLYRRNVKPSEVNTVPVFLYTSRLSWPFYESFQNANIVMVPMVYLIGLRFVDPSGWEVKDWALDSRYWNLASVLDLGLS